MSEVTKSYLHTSQAGLDVGVIDMFRGGVLEQLRQQHLVARQPLYTKELGRSILRKQQEGAGSTHLHRHNEVRIDCLGAERLEHLRVLQERHPPLVRLAQVHQTLRRAI
jgi:hypothetical protein